MKPIFKPRSHRVQEDDDIPVKKQKEEKQKVDPIQNRDIRTGKIHVETLYAVFDNYRNLMSQASYGAHNNPFLLERRVHQMRMKLRSDLIAMGFEDILDFGFIPMPDPVQVGPKTAKEMEKIKKSRLNRSRDED